MLRTAIVGLGVWGETLVGAVANSASIRMVAAYTRSRSAHDRELAARHGLRLADSFEDILRDTGIDAVVLATPPSGHRDQIIAAARAGKHVFCEKPFTMTMADAVAATKATKAAGVTLGLGYNRRFHPSWIDLKGRIVRGELGTILHIECTMSLPNALTAPVDAWRASPAEAPCGGLFPLGVHAVDGFVDLVGPIDQVFCQSLHRAVPSDNDDTTSILFRMRDGMSAYLGIITAAAGSFRFQVYGSMATAYLTGRTHIVGDPSQQRRALLFGHYVIQSVRGDRQEIEVPDFDFNRAELEAFAEAAQGGNAYPIPPSEMVHVVAVTDAIIDSARSGRFEKVR